ncbi:hypothetical protein AALO_G00116640 [Alosa alosa]|uniref:Uncharacterized protein n=1 Tax=Alosa alosa TaxID=278164 RepID=A0AAV6GR98_9TELE|nr:hypothetical protein AALO_G00116640 [Alosa alosa]
MAWVSERGQSNTATQHPGPPFSPQRCCYRGNPHAVSGVDHMREIPKKLLQESDPGHPKPQPLPPPLHDLNVVGDSAPPDGTPPVTTDASPGELHL